MRIKNIHVNFILSGRYARRMRLAGLLLLLTTAVACSQRHTIYNSPPGYDLEDPEKMILSGALQEVSGFALYQGDPATIYAEQDEQGRIYRFAWGNKKTIVSKFGKHGDYEDLAICNDYMVVLRSDGTLFSFLLAGVTGGDVKQVREEKDLLPSGEYESLYADAATNELYVLCKQCNKDKKEEKNAYVLQLQPDGKIKKKDHFVINTSIIADTLEKKKADFRPSALGRHPQTGEWYILSSVNKLLVVTDSNWNIKTVCHLRPSIFGQPEGIDFDRAGNLYISDEGDDLSNPNLLRFRYSPE